MMRTRRCALPCAITAAVVVLLAATSVVAEDDLPVTCHAGKYTINWLGVTDGIHSYELLGSKAAIRKVNRIVIVATRPVAPEDITDPAPSSVRDYCEPDPPTKINQGNCDSFAMSIEPQPNTHTRQTLDIGSTLNTVGTVTMNVITGRHCKHGKGITGSHWKRGKYYGCDHHVGGRGRVVTCIADDGRGIKGPGAEIDPAAPVDVATQFTAGECLVNVAKKANGSVDSVVPGGPCALEVDGEPIGDITIDGRAMIYAPDGTILGSSSSPACYDWFFAGRYYRICAPSWPSPE